MSNQVMHFTIEDVETIVAAQEVIYMRRLLATMRKFIDECPMPPPPPGEGMAIPIKLVQNEINKLNEIETLRARYVRRVHVDPECAKAVANICRENAELAEGIAKTKQQA